MNVDIIGNKCFGCRSCENSCPQKCIKFLENKEGFIYPIIDKNQCVNCGVCLKKCPVINNTIDTKIKKVYGMKSRNKNNSINSSSGGISDVIAKKIILDKGVVFGAVFDDDFFVKHIRIDKEDDLIRMQSSKYVISDTLNTYQEAKKYLDEGVKVLYTGTSCQIQGLLLFLNKKYDNLVTISLICHGVPSFYYFKKYLGFLEKKYKSKIIEYNFRDKRKYGCGLNLFIKFESGKIIRKPMREDCYGDAFLRGLNYRESCYSCPFTTINRVGDISIGDYWGVSKHHSRFYDDNGVSLLIIMTEKGEKIIDDVKDNIDLVESKIEYAIKKQENLRSPTLRPEIRNDIYEKLEEEDFFKKYKIKVSLKNKLLKILPRRILVLLKKIVN